MKKLTEKEKEDIGSKIDNEGFEYYFIDYGPDERLIPLIGKEIEAYRNAHFALMEAFERL